MVKMKAEEIILDVIGIILIGVSIYLFIDEMLDFTQSTIVGCVGLALFVLKGSNIRKYIEKVLDKYLNK